MLERRGRAPFVAVELVEQVEAAALLAEPHALVVAHDGADLQVELAYFVPLVILFQVPQLRVTALHLRARRACARLNASCWIARRDRQETVLVLHPPLAGSC